MPPYTNKSKPVSYADAIRLLSDPAVREDVEEAYTRLTQAMGTLMQRFSTVAKQMHTIDLQRITAPLKPRWDTIWKEYSQVLWQYRAVAASISARLKLFCTSVLPVTTRNPELQTHRSHEEALHVLQSFITISSEHSNQTRSLLERTLRLIREMVSFHSDFAKVVYQQVSSGQREIQDLAFKISELEKQVQQVFSLNLELAQVGPVHSISSIFRIVKAHGKKPGRSRLPNQPLAFTDELARVAKSYETLETKRSEFAHAQYCAEVRSAQTNFPARVQTTIAPLIADAIHHFESSLVLFLSIWARLRTDCCIIFRWLKDPSTEAPVVSLYQESGKGVYVSLAQSLDVYIGSLDPASITPAA
ncbi:hypothetical protein CC2G_014991 [Coprinopsis cinerea AmutBmut pab1-1]|nr:hypothetical protein CC2G_014991 [Coprinopsis cinerea AmutBmut pab1-1]